MKSILAAIALTAMTWPDAGSGRTICCRRPDRRALHRHRTGSMRRPEHLSERIDAHPAFVAPR